MNNEKQLITLKESWDIIEPHISRDPILNAKNHRKFEPKDNTYRFTVDLLSLDLIISLMEDKSIKNVYWSASVPPPGGAIDSLSLRYKIYVEYN